MEKINAYKTSDGRIFEDSKSADIHEEDLTIQMQKEIDYDSKVKMFVRLRLDHIPEDYSDFFKKMLTEHKEPLTKLFKSLD